MKDADGTRGEATTLAARDVATHDAAASSASAPQKMKEAAHKDSFSWCRHIRTTAWNDPTGKGKVDRLGRFL